MKKFNKLGYTLAGLLFSANAFSANPIDVVSAQANSQQIDLLLTSQIQADIRTKDTLVQNRYGLTSQASDVDGDTTYELPEGQSLVGYTAPTGGNFLPNTSLASRYDAYQMPLGFCSFDHGSDNTSTGRVDGNTTPNNSLVLAAVISSGDNRSFDTTCADLSTGTVNGDDIAEIITLGQANYGLSSSAFWAQPVADATALAALDTSSTQEGEVRMVLSEQKLYAWIGSAWTEVSGSGGSSFFQTLDDGANYGDTDLRVSINTGQAPIGKLTVGHEDTIGGSSNSLDNGAIVVSDNNNAGVYMAMDSNEIRQFGNNLYLGGENGIMFETGDGADGDKIEAGKIDSSGNWGIGTTSPTEKLEVDGNVRITENNSLKLGNGGAWLTGLGSQLQVNAYSNIIITADHGGGNSAEYLSLKAGLNNLQIYSGGAGQTDAISYNGNKVFHAGNDGSGSTLDADLLDGLNSTQFLRSDATGSLTGDLSVSGAITGTSFNGVALTAAGDASTFLDNSGTYRALTLNDVDYVRYAGNSIGIGQNSLANDDSTSNYNVALGVSALRSNTSGDYNLATGYEAMYQNTTGRANSAYGGYRTLYSNTTGNGNSAYGSSSLTDNTIGGDNSAFGSEALSGNIDGSNNIAMGSRSGLFLADSSTRNISSDNSVFLGAETKSGAASSENEIVIGYGAIGNGSNTATIGDSNINDFYLGSNQIVSAGKLVDTALNNSGVTAGTYGDGSTVPQFTVDAKGRITGVTEIAVSGGGASSLNELSDAIVTGGSVGLGQGALASDDGSTNNNVAVGLFAANSNTSGYHNSAFGYSSLYSNTTGAGNSAFGSQSLESNTTGNDNAAFGKLALSSNLTGNRNSSFGSGALKSLTGTYHNVAMGYSSLGLATSSYNTGVGSSSLSQVTSGQYNIGLGYAAGNLVATGSNNTIIGNLSGSSALSDTVLIGAGSTERIKADSTGLFINGTQIVSAGKIADTALNDSGVTAGTYGADISIPQITVDAKGRVTSITEVAVAGGGSGATSINDLTDGFYNAKSLGLGVEALINDDGWNQENTAVGWRAMMGQVDGEFNVAIGARALMNGDWSNVNTAVGHRAGMQVTGDWNTMIGKSSMEQATSIFGNVGVGAQSLRNAVGSYNTAIGTAAAQISDGASNTVVGYYGMALSNSGDGNVSVGNYTLFSNNGDGNVAMGLQTMYEAEASSWGVAIGAYSQYYANDTATAWTNTNTSVGTQSLRGGTEPSLNTGLKNTALGYESLLSMTSGSGNIGIGYRAGSAVTTGANNTILGEYEGTATLADTVWIGAGTTERIKADSTGLFINGTQVVSAGKLVDTALNDSGVTAGTYGDGSTVPQFTVDAKGRITGVTEIAVSGGGGASSINDLSDGYSAGYSVGLGGNALINDDGTNNYSTALGYAALENNASGTYNVAVGAFAGKFYGLSSGQNTGSKNGVYLGYLTKASTATAQNEIAIGYNAVGKGDNTAIIGNASVDELWVGAKQVLAGGTITDNVLVNTGVTAGTYGDGSTVPQFTVDAKGRITGVTEIAVSGGGASSINELSDGFANAGNLGLGDKALSVTTGDNNTAVGYWAMRYNGLGYDNTALGMEALKWNSSGHNNVSVGIGTMVNNDTGYQNVALGPYALSGNYVGNQNVAIGADSLTLSDSSGNVAIGFEAGSNVTTGGNNLLLGSLTTVQAGADTNSIVIGANAVGNGSNTATIGDANLTGLYVGADKIYDTNFNASDKGFIINGGAGKAMLAMDSDATTKSMFMTYDSGNILKFEKHNDNFHATVKKTPVKFDMDAGNNALNVQGSGVVRMDYGVAVSGDSALGNTNLNGALDLRPGPGELHPALIHDEHSDYTQQPGYAIQALGPNSKLVYSALNGSQGFAIRRDVWTGSSWYADYILYSDIYDIHAFGNMHATGFVSTSDRRYKDDIKTIDNALDKILAMRGTSYHWKKDTERAKRSHGFIAQELLDVMPDAVHQNDEGFYSVNYDAVIPVLVEAAKELDQKINSNKEAIDELDVRVTAHDRLLEELETYKVRVEELEDKLEPTEEEATPAPEAQNDNNPIYAY